MFETIGKAVTYSAIFVLCLALYAVLLGFPVMWLMNYIFPPQMLVPVFGIVQFTFWKAFWLNSLCGILFKSFQSSKQSS